MEGGAQQGGWGRIALLILDISNLDAKVGASPLQLPPCQGKSSSGPSGNSPAVLWVGGKAPWGSLATGTV